MLAHVRVKIKEKKGSRNRRKSNRHGAPTVLLLGTLPFSQGGCARIWRIARGGDGRRRCGCCQALHRWRGRAGWRMFSGFGEKAGMPLELWTLTRR